MERIDQLENQILALEELGRGSTKHQKGDSKAIGTSQSLKDREIIEYIGEEKDG